MGFSFTKVERILIGLSFILLILFLGTLTLYLTKDQSTQYLAQQYNSMISRLTTECKIDLTELQQQDLERERCQTMHNLYKQGVFDYNQWLSTECQTTVTIQ